MKCGEEERRSQEERREVRKGKERGEGERRGQVRREGRRTDRSDVVCRRGGEISGVGREGRQQKSRERG